MTKITKEEANYLRDNVDDVYIVTTCKQKSKGKRKNRYVAETRRVKYALSKFRKENKR